jgi:hypothetical protein
MASHTGAELKQAAKALGAVVPSQPVVAAEPVADKQSRGVYDGWAEAA